jgi:aspartyl/asparaginyl beta-hydroxylase (cupin superfamily)/cytochrome c-type biogenesis protein CcmH/NrfG
VADAAITPEIQRAIAAARDAQRAGRREEAARLYEAVIAGGGEQPVALNALGVLALARSEPRAAAAWFRRAVAADARAPELWLNLARAFRAEGNDSGEREALEGALAIDQRHFMALVRLAELFERTGDEARAAERWSGVLAMAPMVEQRTPELDAMIDHARDYVAQRQERFAAALDAGLEQARAAADPADRRRFDASVDHMLGRREIYANVCAGLHFPFLPAEEYFERHHFPWIEGIEAQADAIRAELIGLLENGAPGFAPYVAMAPGTPANKWSALDNKLDWGAYHLWKNGVRDDAACARCPVTAAAVEALPLADIPGRAPTVFFSMLKPGTHLPAHTGVTNVRTIIHLPLIVPEGCTFRVGGETRIWREGEAWAFDDTIEHEAWNRSDRPRAILIFDVWNPYLRAGERNLLRDFYPVADRSGYDLRQEADG